jgi:alpha-glucosidase/alpha-D-xyloside xylohydrolase
MPAKKFTIALAVIALLHVSNNVTMAQSNANLLYKDKPAHLVIQQSGPHSVRIKLSNTPGDENEAPNNPAFIEHSWGKPVQLVGGSATVSGLNIKVNYNPLTISINNKAKTVSQSFTVDGKTGVLSFGIADGPVLGLGEGSEKFDKRGAIYTMKNGQVNRDDKMWIASIPVPFLIGTKGWAFFVATPTGEVDLTGKVGKFTQNTGREAVDGPLDMIFFDASQPLEMMKEVTDLVGKPVLPPKWVMGYMQSHRTIDNTTQMLAVVDSFRKKNLPLDAVVYLGTGFVKSGWNTTQPSFVFNPKVFDISPKNFIDQVHAQHTRVILHVVPPTIGGRLQLHGSIPAKTNEPEDSTSISAYWRQHLPAFNLGVDGWWPDEGDSYSIKSRFLRAEMYYKGPLSERPNERPWNLQRNGYLGVARYGGYIWSGDIRSKWETLNAQIAVGLNYSLTVSPFWGTDNGGFVSSKELTGELYTRWFQFSTFCASFRSHGRSWNLRLPWGWNTGNQGVNEDQAANVPDASELHNARVEPICRDFLNLRYQLLPYNYTAAREARDKGLPMMRALWLYYPQDTTAVKQSTEYLWGSEMLIAPITEKGAVKRDVYLPKGSWYNWWTNKKETGGRTVSCPAELETMPIYVKAGAIIPFDPIRQYIQQAVTEPTTIKVYDGANGSYTLYDDDGETQEYLKGQGTWTEFTWNDKDRKLTIKPGAAMASAAKAKTYKIKLMAANKEKVVNYTGKLVEVKL